MMQALFSKGSSTTSRTHNQVLPPPDRSTIAGIHKQTHPQSGVHGHAIHGWADARPGRSMTQRIHNYWNPRPDIHDRADP